MFTGLIEDVGILESLQRHGHAATLLVRTALPAKEIAPGDSIAVNGACLTVECMEGQVMRCHCLAETLSRTNLGDSRTGTRLNLERAVLVGGRMGGHFVTGHVDCCTIVRFFGKRGDDLELEIEMPAEQRPYVVQKGSVAINGVSLTVAGVTSDSLRVCVIPHTGAKTNLPELTPGAHVNLETDLLGKYVVQSMERQNASGLTMEKLAENGFL